MSVRLRAGAVALVAASALLLTACTGTETGTGGADRATGTASPTVDGAAQQRAVTALGSVAETTAGTMRLADGLVPPTNRWFSGLVYGDAPQPVFPTPISWQVTDDGFAAGLPVVSATEKTIAGGAVQQVGLDLGADRTLVSAYDQVSVTVEHRAGATVLGRTVLAQGSPLVSYTAEGPQTVTVTGAVTGTGDGPDGTTTGTIAADGRTWGVVTSGEVDGRSIRLAADGSVVLFPVPDDATTKQVQALSAAAASPLQQVTLARSSTESGSDGVQRTALGYRTAATGKTVIVPQPGQGATGLRCTGLHYATITGDAPVCIGDVLRFSAPSLPADDELDLSGLTSSQRDTLVAQVRADAGGVSEASFGADSYGGGKDLYRVANLYRLATQLDLDDVATGLQQQLVTQIDQWTDPDGCGVSGTRCFLYDDTVKGLVGQAPSYGSDEFNDHHFHYGYLLSAAAIVADGSDDLVAEWKPVLDLVAADIASPAATESFPELRVYDPYAQHSWASGYSPFADGNNQESSSEAVSAWNGLARWGAVSGSRATEELGDWLLANEAVSAQRDVLDPDLRAFPGFEHTVVSLNWGGKRDHATWFSADPAAPAGIELIPMPAVAADYVAAGGEEQIAKVLREAVPEGDYAVQFGDYLLMYRALASGAEAEAALDAARDLPAEDIDTGNTRSYLLAWIMARG
ncbi:glycosyl hydrolase [Curtobacterium sp. MCBD17_021]|uniref:glycosyl hydrolase n=1 Tax=Curtobacterium sp. MCBD17_021 TaxID=2175665 RepID=UPI000DA91E15|nr:glycosyl hydrolase [Curtobacterium sp. MCBD17_021]PZE69744.1 1,3-beta-glucanase [Curtobacterium sp. MCBD17_021]